MRAPSAIMGLAIVISLAAITLAANRVARAIRNQTDVYLCMEAIKAHVPKAELEKYGCLK